VAKLKAWDSNAGSNLKLEPDKGKQIINAKHSATIATTKVHQSEPEEPNEPEEPKEGEYLLHS